MAGTGRAPGPVSTDALWRVGFAVIMLAIAAYAFDARDGLQGLLSVPDSFWWRFNALDLLGLVPLQTGLLLISALSMWAASRWISSTSLRIGLVAAELATAVFVLATVTGFEADQIVFSPVPVLLFLVPLVTTAAYSATARGRGLMRVLGVTVLSLAGGVMLYVIGVILVGSEG